MQKRFAYAVNEPNIVLSYYATPNTVRRTNYFHYSVDDYNRANLLPAPLYFTVQEVPLTAELINQHFEQISRLTTQINAIENSSNRSPLTANLLLHPCVELNLRRTMGHVALNITPSDDDHRKVMRIELTDHYKLSVRLLR